jgi:hypothetical protein
MRRYIFVFSIVFAFVFLAGCNFYLGIDSDGVKVEIWDNETDNNSDNASVIITDISGTERLGRLSREKREFQYFSGGKLRRVSLTESGQTFRGMSDDGLAVSFVFAEICADGNVCEINAETLREDWSQVAVACDSACGLSVEEIYDYADRNGFDAYCLPEQAGE